mgnify:CR=1 FL=1
MTVATKYLPLSALSDWALGPKSFLTDRPLLMQLCKEAQSLPLF